MTMNSGGSGQYYVNENVSLNGTVVGEVVSWDEGVRKLTIKDNTRTLAIGDTLVGANSASYTIASITDILTFANDGNAQNKEFEDKADNYLDFSETNPFGSPT